MVNPQTNLQVTLTNIICSVNHNLALEECTQQRQLIVTYFADKILMNMDKGFVTGSVFFDLAKAKETSTVVTTSFDC